MPDALKGVSVTYQPRGNTTIVTLDPETYFTPFRLWEMRQELEMICELRDVQVFLDVTIKNGKLHLEFSNYGRPEGSLFQRIKRLLAPVTPGDLAIKPLALFRKEGEIALDPSVPISVERLNSFMADISTKYKLDSRWCAKLNNHGYLCVWLENTQLDIEDLATVFEPTFLGTCIIRARTYLAEPHQVVYTLTYGGAFPLNLRRAGHYGFYGLKSVRSQPYTYRVCGPRANDLDTDLDRCVYLAQALGCLPVEGVSLHWRQFHVAVRPPMPLTIWLQPDPPQ